MRGMTFLILAGSRRRAPHDKLRERGLTLIELCAVLGILMIMGGMLFISAVKAVQNIRLYQSATSYANLLQQARMRAVQDDRYYTVLTSTGSQSPSAFVDLNGSGSYAAGDPTMVFSQNVSPKPFSSGPGLADLKSKFLPAGVLGQGSVNTTAPGPTFGPRGLPCTPNAGTCPYQTPLGMPTSYITFLQNSQSTKWEAVTVTPAGRIRIWSYDGTSWSPLN